VVLDTVGGATLERSYGVLLYVKPGVAAVEAPVQA
jgi:hypothetical protein